MSALTSSLVRDGVVPVRKIEEALQRQVISGGDVETVLLEMEAVPENALTGYRAALYDLPPAGRDAVMNVVPEVIRLMPAEVAIQHRAIPIAIEGTTLHIARREPLSAEQEERLGFLLGFAVVTHIGCEVRIAAGLASHYGADLTPRFARLIARLKTLDAGELPNIGRMSHPSLAPHGSEIPYKTKSDRANLGAHFESQTQPLGHLMGPPTAFVDERGRPRRDTARGLGAVTEQLIQQDLASAEAAQRGAQREAHQREVQRAAQREAEAPQQAPQRESRKDRTALRRLRGPLTLPAGERMLKRATDRDQILGVLFSFAQQFFDYTALFVVHEDMADGREAWGVGASTEEVRRISVPLGKPSVFARARQTLAPVVSHLDATEVDRDAAALLRRATTPLAMVMPIAIRQRVVILVYGDRDGEEFEIGSVMDLVRFSSRVIESLEALILRKKRVGYHTEPPPAPVEDRTSLKEAAQSVASTAGTMRPTRERQRLDSGSWHAGRRTAPEFAPLVNEIDADSWTSVAEAGAPRAEERRPSTAPPPAPERRIRDTIQDMPAVREVAAPVPVAPVPQKRPQGLPANAPPSAVLGIPRIAPPPPPSAELSLDSSDLDLPIDTETSEPETLIGADDDDEEPAPRLGGQADLSAVQVVAPPRIVQAVVPPSAVIQPKAVAPPSDDDDEPVTVVGEDDDEELDDDAADEEPEMSLGDDEDADDDDDDMEYVADEPEEPRRPSNRPRPRGTYRVRGGHVDVLRPRALTEQASPEEPLQEGEMRLPRVWAPPPAPKADTDAASVIIDMGEQVHAQVGDLLAAPTPALQNQLLRGLMHLGEPALPALVQAFPGPLRYDRHSSTGKPPPGRDLSIIARAIVAFGETAVPYVASLLSSGDSDVRYYAALVAAELIHPGLLEALTERIYDEDPAVRRLACAILPRLAGHRGFEEVRILVRRVARVRGKDVSRRRHAIDALAALRDTDFIEKLIELLKDEEDAGLKEHVRRALVVMTCTDQGPTHRRWRAWYEKHGDRHRIEWLIEGLVHPEESIRRIAGEELKRITQEQYGYHPGAPRRERERVQKLFRRWWDDEGKRRYA